MLFARIANYRRELCDALLYPRHGERRLFEAYNKSLNLLPVGEPLGIWLERGFDPETDGFVSAFRETLRAFATFVGA